MLRKKEKNVNLFSFVSIDACMKVNNNTVGGVWEHTCMYLFISLYIYGFSNNYSAVVIALQGLIKTRNVDQFDRWEN